MEIFDISVPVHPGMVVYDGDPDVHMERVKTIAGGSSANVSRLDFGVHTGTHIDAPVHFIEGAGATETVALDALVGPAVVVDATMQTDNIDAAALSRLEIPAGTERVIFKTHELAACGICRRSRRTSSGCWETRRRCSLSKACGWWASTTCRSGRRETACRRTRRCCGRAW